LAAEHRDDHRAGRAGTVVLGELAGFKLEFRSTWPDKVTLRGAGEYPANISASPVGTIGSLEHAARAIDEQATRGREELARCRSHLAELTALTGKVFEHEERYRGLLKRQGELVDLLDITKNQAAAQQATVATGNEESVTPKVPEADSPGEDESPEETHSPAVVPQTAVKKGSRIRSSKSRPAEPVAPIQQLAPTVHLSPRLPARMKIAV
jgi:hypothetical protein